MTLSQRISEELLLENNDKKIIGFNAGAKKTDESPNTKLKFFLDRILLNELSENR